MRYYILADYPSSIYGITTEDPDRNFTVIWRVEGAARAHLLAKAVDNRFAGRDYRFCCKAASDYKDFERVQIEQTIDERISQMGDGSADPDWPIYEVTKYAIECEPHLDSAASTDDPPFGSRISNN